MFIIASVGRKDAVTLEEKKLLFDAAATFYCRALSSGCQTIPSTSKIQGASDAFNQVEAWLTKWRHNVVMHEFCVQRGFLLCPTFYNGITACKYVVDSFESVDERLQAAQDLSMYHIRYLNKKTDDLEVPVSDYSVIGSQPQSFSVPFPVLTEQSLVSLNGADLQDCKNVFKDFWSLLLMKDMLEEALMCFHKYLDRESGCIQSILEGTGLSTPRTALHKKVLKIAYLIKAVNLVYATHSSGHLTKGNKVSQLLGDIRAGGAHGSSEPGGYFEWPVISAGISDVVQALFENIVLPSDEQVEMIRSEAATLLRTAEEMSVVEKIKLVNLIDVHKSSLNDLKVPAGLSSIILNGPKKTTVEVVPDLFDIMRETDTDNVFGTLFE